MKKPIIRKRYFILLEILIAVALMACCAIPLVRNPLYFYKKEMANLEDLSLIMMKKEALFEIKQMLFKNEIPWEDFSMNKKGQAPIRTLPPKTLIIKGFKKKEVTAYYRIWAQTDKPCENEVICRKVGVQISIGTTFHKKEDYDIYILFAQKKKSISEQPSKPL